MKIKLAVLVVIAATFISIEQTALWQYMPHPKPTVDSIVQTKFDHIVGRYPTPQELTFWKNVARGNENTGSDAKVETLIMDWFLT